MKWLNIVVLVTFVLFVYSAPLAQQQSPSLMFGTSSIALGMTHAQVSQALATANRHIKMMSEDSGAVVNGRQEDWEGQIIFSNDRVVYAAFDLPPVRNTDDLAQEIAGAVDNMDSNNCAVHNYTSHGTGGSTAVTKFECGSRRFSIMTTQVYGQQKSVGVKLEIGNAQTK